MILHYLPFYIATIFFPISQIVKFKIVKLSEKAECIVLQNPYLVQKKISFPTDLQWENSII